MHLFSFHHRGNSFLKTVRKSELCISGLWLRRIYFGLYISLQWVLGVLFFIVLVFFSCNLMFWRKFSANCCLKCSYTHIKSVCAFIICYNWETFAHCNTPTVLLNFSMSMTHTYIFAQILFLMHICFLLLLLFVWIVSLGY